MEPAFRAGEYMLVRKLGKRSNLSVRDVVIFQATNGEKLLKRIKEISEEGYILAGDNASDSWDSRNFGPIHRTSITGKVMNLR
jgi:type IV secretory pathway protease TraF